MCVCLQSSTEEQYGGEAPLSEPESRLLKHLIDQRKTLGYVNVHSGEWALYTPWDSKPAYAPDLPVSEEEGGSGRGQGGKRGWGVHGGWGMSSRKGEGRDGGMEGGRGGEGEGAQEGEGEKWNREGGRGEGREEWEEGSGEGGRNTGLVEERGNKTGE